MSEDNSEFVDIPVPKRFAGDVTMFLADLYRRESGDGPAGSSAEEAVKLDAAVVSRMYIDSEDRHRELLDFLAAHPGEWIYTSELAKAIGVSTGTRGMAGVLGAFGRRAKHRYGGLKPWVMTWDPTRGEARYRMSPEVASWVKEPF